MKPRSSLVLAGLATLPFAAVLVAWLGIFNVAASTGHWPITNWFLHFAMRSSVRTYAFGITVPDLRKTGLLQPAAAHFDTGCAFCHGAPGMVPSPAALAMLPPPPYLVHKVGEWTDAQLFRIIRHGVRYTGMPAWPALERTDEIWGMVAFLRRLPSLDAEGYRRLVEEPSVRDRPSAFDAAIARCARCHGRDGIGRDEAVPVIAGQSSAYLIGSLRAYVEGKRPSGMMEVALSQTDASILDMLARYYAGQPLPAKPVGADPVSAARGREIAEQGLPGKSVPACLGCHGGSRKNPAYPKIVGQKRAYLEAQLRLFAESRRGGTDYAHIMTKVAGKLSEKDIEDVATYLTSIK
ncbi:c-type cytochrome [Pseudaminobacter arsenicus]|uniref:C-type cytochrome n=1 Tax=Borborobacter arsenicus TaxID=1851146 RepID=A0A432UZ71_9HYPH|nr:c-type cytochrome [Pseudaminobacter arsenicus]RUM95209.1 c-type cytochrome [Pseudaminobacter arsenicus]